MSKNKAWIPPEEVAAALGAKALGTFHEIVAKLSAAQRVDCATAFDVTVAEVESWARPAKSVRHMLSPTQRWQVVRWVVRTVNPPS